MVGGSRGKSGAEGGRSWALPLCLARSIGCCGQALQTALLQSERVGMREHSANRRF